MDPDLDRDLRTLVDVARIRILGRLAMGPATLDVLSDELRIARPALTRHLSRLTDAGLIASDDGSWAFRPDGVMSIGRRLAALEPMPAEASSAADGSVSPEDAKVLRAFVVDGRLASVPVQDRKRSVVLRWVLERCFAEDRPYPEREVNERLREVHEDHAALRRYLVDGGLMDREAGIYRRRVADAPETSNGRAPSTSSRRAPGAGAEAP